MVNNFVTYKIGRIRDEIMIYGIIIHESTASGTMELMVETKQEVSCPIRHL